MLNSYLLLLEQGTIKVCTIENRRLFRISSICYELRNLLSRMSEDDRAAKAARAKAMVTYRAHNLGTKLTLS